MESQSDGPALDQVAVPIPVPLQDVPDAVAREGLAVHPAESLDDPSVGTQDFHPDRPAFGVGVHLQLVADEDEGPGGEGSPVRGLDGDETVQPQPGQADPARLRVAVVPDAPVAGGASQVVDPDLVADHEGRLKRVDAAPVPVLPMLAVGEDGGFPGDPPPVAPSLFQLVMRDGALGADPGPGEAVAAEGQLGVGLVHPQLVRRDRFMGLAVVGLQKSDVDPCVGHDLHSVVLGCRRFVHLGPADHGELRRPVDEVLALGSGDESDVGRPEAEVGHVVARSRVPMGGRDGIAVGNDRIQGLRRPADAVGRVGDEGGPPVSDLGVHVTVHHLVAASGIGVHRILEDGRRIGVDGSVGEVVPVTGVDDRFFPDQPVPGGGVAQHAFDLPAVRRLLLLDEVGVPHLEDPLRLVVEDRAAVELLGLPGPVGNQQGIVGVFHGPLQDFAGAPEFLDDVIVDEQLFALDDDGVPQDRVVQIPERP